jgi:predicted O-methyltransferase YrrM
MKRAVTRPAVSTQIKDGLNAFLNTAGLQISTMKGGRREQTRLKKLVARGHWNAVSFSEGLALDPERYLAFLKSVCSAYLPELGALPVAEAGNDEFFRNNGWFESVDADVLYGIVRHFAPQQVIEVGSGYSSRLTARAIREGHLRTKLVCVDPCPRVEIRQCADEFVQSPVEELPVSALPDRLSPGDVLFIDTSHLIMTGGDVVYLYLQVLPRLRPGVLIHAHDIFLPFEYPQEFVLDERWGWAEQYLVHALLIGNRGFEILWPSCYMWQTHREEVSGILRVEKPFPPPSSLWLRKTGN